MHRERFHLRQWLTLAAVFLAALLLVSCEEKRNAPTGTLAAAKVEVFVLFEGPWAFVDDPHDSNSVLALAPKSNLHRQLYVSASNEAILDGGIYTLAVPPHGTASNVPSEGTFAQGKISAQSLQRAMDDRSARYVIRLPKPEGYIAANRHVSRVGPNYPPDPSTEQNYVTIVSLRYAVGALSGFTLSGNSDSGTFTPLALAIETPQIRFAIEPSKVDDASDRCHLHSRQAFASTVKLLNLALFVDFPGDPSSCQGSDPQRSRSANAATHRSWPLLQFARQGIEPAPGLIASEVQRLSHSAAVLVSELVLAPRDGRGLPCANFISNDRRLTPVATATIKLILEQASLQRG